MPQYYLTVQKTKVYNLTIDAETEAEAQEKAIDELQFVRSDFELEPEVVECVEVVRGVNEW